MHATKAADKNREIIDSDGYSTPAMALMISLSGKTPNGMEFRPLCYQLNEERS